MTMESTNPALAPVVVFAYMRPDHLRRTIESLLVNPEAAQTDVTIYCDGPKRAEHLGGVEAVRRYVASVSGFRSVTRIHRETNFGLAPSVIEGVTRTLKCSDRVIVLEDDLHLSPHFLRYMNDALERYAQEPRVASVHAYSYPTREPLPETFFLEGADCWGWATWARAWQHFEADGAKLLDELERRRLVRDFDLDGSYPYSGMLRDQIAGVNSSWAIRWHAACFLRGLLTLYPGRSLVENIGNDASGTHCEVDEVYSRPPTERPVEVAAIPVEPSALARAAFARFLGASRPWHERVRATVGRLLRSAA